LSYNYKKYRAMSEAQLQQAIDDRKVTLEYLNWLGKQKRDVLND